MNSRQRPRFKDFSLGKDPPPNTVAHRCCRKCIGYFSAEDYLIACIFISASAVLAFLSIQSTTTETVQKDSDRSTMAYMTIPFYLLGAIIGFTFLKFPINRKILLVLIGVCLIIPLFLILLLSLASSLTESAVLALCILPSCFLFFLFLKTLKFGYNSLGVPLSGTIVIALYCLLIPILSVGVPIYLALTTENIEEDFWVQVGYITAVPIIISIALPWTIVHLKFYRGTVSQEAEGNFASISDVFIVHFNDIQQRRINNISSASMIISILVTEGILGYFLADSFERKGKEEREIQYLLILLIFMVPLFSILGFAWAASAVKKEDKLFYTSIIVGFLPLPLTYSLYLIYGDEYPTLFGSLIILPPGTVLYWGSIILLKDSYPVLFKPIASITCVFIAFPIGILLPLYFAGVVSSYYITVGIVGIALIGGVAGIVYKLVKFIKLNRIQKKIVMASWFWYNPTLWISTAVFLGGSVTIIWSYDLSRDDEWIEGLLIALVILFPFFYCSISMLLRIQLTQSDDLTIDEDRNDHYIISKNKKRLKQFSSLFCALGIFLMLVGIGFYQLVNSVVFVVLLFLGLGLSLISCSSIALGKGKSVLGKYAKRVTSLIVSCCWCFIFLPFMVLLPTSLAISNDSDLALIISTTLGFAFVLIIGGVSFFSIFLNLLMKRMEQEKKAKKATNALKKALKSTLIKADPNTLRILYDQYSLFGRESYRQLLQDQSVFFLDDVEDGFYLKQIRSAEVLRKQEQKRLRMETERSTSKINRNFSDPTISCWDMLSCFNLPEEEIEEVVTEEAESFDESQIPRDLDHEIEEKFNVHIQHYGDVGAVPNHPVPNFQRIRLLEGQQYLQMCDNHQNKNKWLALVFSFFSRGYDEISDTFFMSFTDLKEFMRLSGLFNPGPYGPIGIQTVYCRATEFDTENSKLMTQKVFIGKYLPILAKSRFGRRPQKEAQEKLFEEYLYPNLMYNLKGEFKLKRDRIARRPSIKAPTTTVFSVSPSTMTDDPPFEEKFYTCNLKLERCMRKLSTHLINCISSIAESLTKLLISIVKVEPEEEEEESPVKQEVTMDESVPEWPETTDLIIQTIEEAMTETSDEIFTMECSMTNLAFLGSRVFEYFSMCAIAFRPQIDWGPMAKESEQASDATLVETSEFIIPFWTSLGLSILFLIIMKPAATLKKQGKLGKDSQGNPAKFYHLSFWITRLLNALGNVLYIQIVKSLLAVFACDMSSDPWLVRGSTMECYSSLHLLYLAFGAIGIAIYYPLATFNFPDMQYYSFGLDFKFDSTFLVVLSQGKLIIAGVSTFFDYSENLSVQLIVNGAVLIVIVVLNIKIKPCILQKFNMWNTLGYGISLWAVTIALFIVWTGASLVGFYVFWTGFIIIISVGVVLHFKKYGLPCRNSAQVHPDEAPSPVRKHRFSSIIKFFS